MENNNIWIWIAAIVGACIGGFILKHLRIIKNPTMNVDEEYADGEIAFDDMVAYFKSLHLKRDDGMCAIVSDKHAMFHKILFKEGYISLGLFVLDEKKNEIVKGKIIHAKGFDTKTTKSFDGHDIIKLS